MAIVFWAVSLLGLAYFLGAKRHFDFYTVAFVSGIAYFLPGFFGHVLVPSWTNPLTPVPLLPETYAVMSAVLLAIIAGGFFFENIWGESSLALTITSSEGGASWATVIAVCGFLFTVATTGSALLDPNKTQMMQQLNRWYIVATTAASLAAAWAFLRRRWRLFAISMAIIAGDLYIGFRNNAAILVIALLALAMADRGRRRLITAHWRLGLGGTVIAFFFFLWKGLVGLIKLGAWDLVADRLTHASFYGSVVTESEPFVTQCILNEVIARRFEVGVAHFGSLIYQLMFFSSDLGANLSSFNDLFQPALFPQAIGWGMADNIWAEMIASGGPLLLAVMIILFVVGVGVGSYFMRSRNPELRGLVALTTVPWAFYIHRNDLLFQMTEERRYFFVGVITLLVAKVAVAGRSQRRTIPLDLSPLQAPDPHLHRRAPTGRKGA